MLTGRKMARTAKNKIHGFCSVGTPPKNFNFFDHHCKGKVFTNILYVEGLFWFELYLWLFEWRQLVFLAHTKTGFPLKRRHNGVTGARNLPQKMRCCQPDSMMSSLTL